MPKGQQCPFCQLIANPSQLKLVGETDNFYAWLDINPRARGYTMVVPKEHIGSVEEFSPSEYQEAMGLVRKVIDKARDGLGADGASVTMNIDEAAGQMVPHAYIQVFPRFEDEETSGTPTGAVFQPHEEAKKNLDEIREKMASVDSDFGETTKEAHPDSKKFKSGNPEESGSDNDTSGKEPEKKSGSKSSGPLMNTPGPLSMSGSKTKDSSDSSKTKDSETVDKSDQDGESEDSGKDRQPEADEDFEGKSFEWS